jgi:ribosomal protein L40E
MTAYTNTTCTDRSTALGLVPSAFGNSIGSGRSLANSTRQGTRTFKYMHCSSCGKNNDKDATKCAYCGNTALEYVTETILSSA